MYVHRLGVASKEVAPESSRRTPQAEEKIHDVVGLYLSPPTNAVVLSLDEKTEIQALSRTQPLLPLRLGLPARQTYDYRRNGLTSLYAALEVATGGLSPVAASVMGIKRNVNTPLERRSWSPIQYQRPP